MVVQPLQITGLAIAKLDPIERNKIARGLDYVGFVPGLGSVGGIARLIGAITALIFCSIKLADAEGAQKENLLIWRTVAGHEALRGLCEITWIFNILLASLLACCVTDSAFSDTDYNLNDEQYVANRTRYKPILGILSLGGPFAHGNYIYKDTSERSEAIHYSYKKYDGNQVIWRSIISRFDGYRGTEGVVLKLTYSAERDTTRPANYIVTKKTD